jgi:hypothetical protein
MAKKRSKFTRESKSTAKRRTFSREFKADAVKLAKDTGKGVTAKLSPRPSTPLAVVASSNDHGRFLWDYSIRIRTRRRPEPTRSVLESEMTWLRPMYHL